MHPRLSVAAPLAACLLIAACRSTPTSTPVTVTADTYAVVNGRAITRDEVEKSYRRTSNPAQPVADEEATTAKMGILDELIMEEILLAKANALKIQVNESDIDAAYAAAKKNIGDEAYQKELTARTLTTADMRDRLRRELIAQKVLEHEVGAKVIVSDQQVTDFFNANRAQFNLPEDALHLAQIIVTPVRDQQIANRTGDDATTPEAAVAKIKMLMERLKSGASFRDLAVGYSEDPESAPRGGDLGLIPVSQLRQAPPPLRDAVLGKEAGAVNVASSNGAYALMLVVAHEQPGQRDLSMPGVRDGITQTLRGRKEQLLRAAYLTSVRSDAQVVNYLARRLVETQGAMPNAPLSSPAAK